MCTTATPVLQGGVYVKVQPDRLESVLVYNFTCDILHRIRTYTHYDQARELVPGVCIHQVDRDACWLNCVVVDRP